MILSEEEVGVIVEGLGTSADDLENEQLIWSRIAEAQLKKVAKYWDGDCQHNVHRLRRECALCWQLALEEVE